MTKDVDSLLKALRVPFPSHQISWKPKETKAQKEERERDFKKGVKCSKCGQWHHKDAVHLEYVGHAALTDRLLEVDPLWNWEPVSFGPDGQPAFDRLGGMWIKLTVCGHTRLGYGSADGKTGGDAVKEVIGDALRNAAMRFGAALDLWHKGDLHATEGDNDADAHTHEVAKQPTKAQTKAPPPPSDDEADESARRYIDGIKADIAKLMTAEAVRTLHAREADARKAMALTKEEVNEIVEACKARIHEIEAGAKALAMAAP